MRNYRRLVPTLLLALGVTLLHAAPGSATLPDPLAGFEFQQSAFGLSASGRPESSTATGATLVMSADCAAGVTTTTSAITEPCNITSGFGSDADGDYLTWTSPKKTGGGFQVLMNTPIGDTYTIAMKFAISDDTGYRKLVDFKNRTSDNGFYILNGRITFYPSGNSTQQFPTGSVLDLVLVRNGTDKTFKTYLRVAGGQLDLIDTYDDSGDDAVPATVNGKSLFGFFIDDTMVSNEGAIEGRIYSIKSWDIALTQTEVTAATSSAAPTLSWIDSSLGNLTEGQPFSDGVNANGAVSYALSGSLPTGLIFNSATGAITGTPTVSGPYSFTITATAADNSTISETFTGSVQAASSQAPVVVFPAFEVQEVLNSPLAVGDLAVGKVSSDDATVKWSLQPGGNAQLFTINAQGILSLRGQVPAGTYIVAVTGTDIHGNSVTRMIQIHITEKTAGTGESANSSPNCSLRPGLVVGFSKDADTLSTSMGTRISAIAGSGCTGNFVVDGHVQPTKSRSNDARLSRARANALVQALRTAHPNAVFTIRVRGAASARECTSVSNRCAVIRAQ